MVVSFGEIVHFFLGRTEIKRGEKAGVHFIRPESAFERGEGVRGIFEGGVFGRVVGLGEGGCTIIL